MFRTY